MRTLSLSTLTVLWVVYTEAQVLFRGRCPTPDVVENIVLADYAGTWYEAARFPSWLQRRDACVADVYSAETDGFGIEYSAITRAGRERTLSGEAEFVDDSGNATFRATFGRRFNNNFSRGANYNVLFFNENVALVWNCRNFFNAFNAQMLRVLARERPIRRFIVPNAETRLRNRFGLDPDKLRLTRQTDCTN